ncbi:growth hormone secretagogue receptor type 1-like [Lineus longissimus]|uniref:growth hormone secretagogue receptor type 1-like n=1 Tax=Lineus longissimus TaxID=88925 RepID=UPI00315D79F3
MGIDKVLSNSDWSNGSGIVSGAKVQQTIQPTLSDEARYMYKVFDIIHYTVYIAILLGIPGNILTILVSSMTHNRKHTASVYMIGLAIPDGLFLVQECIALPLWRERLATFWPSKEWETKYYYFVTYTCGMTSGLILAAMSIDRFIAIRYPMTAKTICTVKKAKIIVITIPMIVTGLNLSTFFCHSIMKDGTSGVEFLVVSVPDNPVFEVLFTNFQLIFGSILPSVIIIASNIGIVTTIRKASRDRAKMGVGTGKDSQKRESQLTSMLILVSVAYLVFTIPHKLFYQLFNAIPAVNAPYDMSNIYWNLKFNIIVVLLFNIWLCNHAVNFFLYCIAGGRGYREDTKRALKSIFCMKK